MKGIHALLLGALIVSSTSRSVLADVSASDFPDGCNSNVTCGTAAACSPGEDCCIGTLDEECPNLTAYHCSDSGSWQKSAWVSSTCGQLCGERAVTQGNAEEYKVFPNSLCGGDGCVLPVSRASITQSEVAETVIDCPTDARPPKPNPITLPCEVKGHTELWQNPNGIGNGAPPGDKHETVDITVEDDTNCPEPTRETNTQHSCTPEELCP